jgi:ESF2/ABP1 family protein
MRNEREEVSTTHSFIGLSLIVEDKNWLSRQNKLEMKKDSKVGSSQNEEKEDNRFSMKADFGSKKAKSRSEDVDCDLDNLDDGGEESDDNSDIEGNVDDGDNEIEEDDDDEEEDEADMDEENKSDFVSGAKATQLREDAKAYSANLEKRGVVYMSRVPPFMKPNKARVLFEQFGVVTRIYLAEEDSQIRY